jgi:hypothetical protein
MEALEEGNRQRYLVLLKDGGNVLSNLNELNDDQESSSVLDVSSSSDEKCSSPPRKRKKQDKTPPRKPTLQKTTPPRKTIAQDFKRGGFAVAIILIQTYLSQIIFIGTHVCSWTDRSGSHLGCCILQRHEHGVGM